MSTDYKKMYKKIFDMLGELTPLKTDCGVLCSCACCKGDKYTGMRLFPHEETTLDVETLKDGGRLAVCDGTCDREHRPLACRIFPFFPTIADNGKIFVELDYRAKRVCPMIGYSEQILFDKKFIKAVKKVGKVLSKDELCRQFLYQSTEEIDMFYDFLVKDRSNSDT